MEKVNKKVVVSSVVLFFIMCGSFGFVKGEDKIKLKLVKKMNFEKAEEIKIENGKPKAVIVDGGRNKKIIFLDDKGNSKRKIKIDLEKQVLFLSRNGEYVGIGTYKMTKEEFVRHRKVRMAFELQDKNGRRIWKKDEIKGDTAIISPDGSLVITTYEVGGNRRVYQGLYFYDSSGNLIKHIDKEFPRYRNLPVISNDGDIVVMRDYEGVVAFDKNGNEMWRYGIDGKLEFEKIKISDDKKHIGISFFDWNIKTGYILVFSKEGQLLINKSFYHGSPVFSVKKDILVVKAKGIISAFKISTNELLWEYEYITELTGSIIDDDGIAISPDGNYVCASLYRWIPSHIRPTHCEIYIYIFNMRGKKFLDYKLDGKYKENSKIYFSDNDLITLIVGEKIHYFNLKI